MSFLDPLYQGPLGHKAGELVKLGSDSPGDRRKMNKWPWERLKVGESFETPAFDAVRPMASRAGARLGRKFKVNRMPQGYKITRTR